MILVDSSVWVDHLRSTEPGLFNLLEGNHVLMHAFVIGELACGNLRNRAELLKLFRDLPQAAVAEDSEVLFLIERNQLMGRGIGYVDAHLLASVMLHGAAKFWTRDRRLLEAADSLGLAHSANCHK